MATILHIEDDPLSRRLVEKLLVRAGHDVIDTASGLEGIELARQHRPDLVLVDINVPDLDGYEVTLRLRGMPELERVPIVAITAEGDKQTSLAVGANGFLEKPIDARHFARQVASFLEGHRELADEDTGEIKLREASQKIVLRLEDKVRALSKANVDLEEAMRLRTEFLRNVTHELATPMTPVVGYLKLLLAEELGPLTELQSKSLRAIERATDRLREVTDTLLDVSALESQRMHFFERQYDFRALVIEAMETLAIPAEARNIVFVHAIETEPLICRGDPEKLRRAFVHVLDNAMKFTPRAGRVAVEVVEEEELVHLRVMDGGPGIDREQRERIFEPFVQVDGSPTRKHGGVGLGLAFARRVCEVMGGGVRVDDSANAHVAGLHLPGTLIVITVKR